MMNPTLRSTKIRWWIAGLMWLAVAINYIDRTVLSAAAPHLITELEINPEMMGLIMAAFFWSYALLQIPAGWFADRFGQKKRARHRGRLVVDRHHGDGPGDRL
ncbi:MFS transporter [Pantoea tagorei]